MVAPDFVPDCVVPRVASHLSPTTELSSFGAVSQQSKTTVLIFTRLPCCPAVVLSTRWVRTHAFTFLAYQSLRVVGIIGPPGFMGEC